MARSAPNHGREHPSARSRYPTESPPKKAAPSLLELELISAKAFSRLRTAACVSLSFSALASSVAAFMIPVHAGNSLPSM
uniref:Uncharacterized protein n=1 Tax=Zea mays TaxID=4577 RepID=B6U6N1_MAIZE|nr:hypothetical protein [Zea mays]